MPESPPSGQTPRGTTETSPGPEPTPARREDTGTVAVWAAWVGARVASILLGCLVVITDRGNSFVDIDYYARWAADGMSGVRVPYRDFGWEYPPLAFPFMAAPHLVSDVMSYRVAWVLMLMVVDAAVLFVVRRATRTSTSPRGGRLGHPAVLAWVFGPPVLGALSWSRFDLLPAAAACLAVIAAGRARSGLSGAAAGVGVALKVWPAVLAPVQRTWRGAIRATLAALGVVAVTAGVTYSITGSSGFGSVFNYQADRGIQLESVAAIPLHWIQMRDDSLTESVFRFGAFEITGPHEELIGTIASVVTLLGGLAIGLSHLLLMRRDAGARGVAATAVTGLLLVTVGNKVFSPQYVLWLLAAVVAAAALDPRTWRWLVPPVLVVAGLTQAIFPTWYEYVIQSRPLGVGLLTARAVLLLGMLGYAAWVLAGLVRAEIVAWRGERQASSAGVAAVPGTGTATP